MAGLTAGVVVRHMPVLHERRISYGQKRILPVGNNRTSFSGQKVERMPLHRKNFKCIGWPCAGERYIVGNMSSLCASVSGVNVLKKNFKRSSQLKSIRETGIRALAMETATEAFLPDEGELKSGRGYYTQANSLSSTIPMSPPNRADDPSLCNPLLRSERMGCGWFAVIMEWEGVVVEDHPDLESRAWLALAEEEGERPPLAFILKRVEGMKSEQAISEVLCWSRDPLQVRRLALRKEELYQEMQGGFYRLRPGSYDFVVTLKNYNIPMALASTRPRKYLEAAVETVGMQGFFNVVVAAEDVYRGKPDPEMFMYAAQLLSFITERCIVFGNSNSSVEAAHDSCMKCVAVAGKHPVYELGAADMVVRRLDELSLVDLKNLADLDSPEFQPPQPEPEFEMEVESSSSSVAVQEIW
uniref:TSA: Wollemia nobilis Ref_Wollemi_Transcript_2530_2271 transcribed RNA sequence n=1 Tax=Wollemia nobilis TaxID=56998 RepID=A0A0C9SAL1_9CONI